MTKSIKKIKKVKGYISVQLLGWRGEGEYAAIKNGRDTGIRISATSVVDFEESNPDGIMLLTSEGKCWVEGVERHERSAEQRIAAGKLSYNGVQSSLETGCLYTTKGGYQGITLKDVQKYASKRTKLGS